MVGIEVTEGEFQDDELAQTVVWGQGGKELAGRRQLLGLPEQSRAYIEGLELEALG
jgi:hypothetical protein